jgi:putative peptidoglycan lipid II flippase
MEEFKEGVNFSLRLILFITLPAMAGLIILRVPILNLIFQHGAFTYDRTILSAQALLCYSFSIWAYGGINVLSRAFYALNDVKTPFLTAIVAMVVNFLVGVILMYPLRHAGLALANSCAAIVNVALLTLFFHRKTSGLRWKKLLSSLFTIVLAVIPMSLVVILVERRYTWTESGGYAVKIPLLGGGIIVAMAIFFLCSYLLRNRELRFLWESIRSGRARQRPSSTPQG